MKFELLQLSKQRQVQLLILSRIILAIVAGFLIASFSVALIAKLYPATRAVATYTGLLLSFLIWLIYIIYIFSTKRLGRGSIYTVGILLLLCAWVLLFKQGGGA
ncbi:hypothetical protein EC844_11076 [Acinetobacter calcoaceticus]|uniref:Iron transporter n=1 Tax=Acinetobacter calcoaceticus TaxID=471 RepID=A0A4R1XXJ8_ACICA|nr:hypothetical protein EC844_11076 [Acinetobacter calcoaceticus]